ncbi:MAG: hypothetical protein GX542_13255 [Rhodococcus sp.]|nr:hypothetical protein [Rhodococcus sp. (in: high G+C Gram-positive bacteria)]
MKDLVDASTVTAACALMTWTMLLLLLIAKAVGTVDAVGNASAVVIPVATVIGLLFALAGALVGISISTSSIREHLGWPGICMLVGQIATTVIAAGIISWALLGTTGWELLFVPVATMLGQLPVIVGRGAITVRRHRARKARISATPRASTTHERPVNPSS